MGIKVNFTPLQYVGGFIVMVFLAVLYFYRVVSFGNTSLLYVYDNAEIFEYSERDKLDKQCRELNEALSVEVYVLTDSSSKGKGTVRYVEDFADSRQVTDAVILFVSMEPGNRTVEIQGYGSAEKKVDNKRIEYILDLIIPKMKNGNYEQAMNLFLEQVEKSYSSNPLESNLQLKTSVIASLVISMVISTGVMVVMIAHTKGKNTVNHRTYLNQSDSIWIERYDNYINTTLTKHAKPKDNSSGSSSSGVSSGGRSHSGGSRNF